MLVLTICNFVFDLNDFVQQINLFVVLFWRGWRYAVDIMYCHVVNPFSCCDCRSPLIYMRSVKNILNPGHLLISADCWCHSRIYSFKVAVCAKILISFYTIIVSVIVFPPALENNHTISSWSIRGERISVGLNGPIIFTAFP